MKLRLVFKGGPGSGHFGHAGRPGKVGGSQSDNKKTASYQVEAHGTNTDIFMVKGKQDLPMDVQNTLKASLTSSEIFNRFIYNAKTKTWHIAAENASIVDHGSFISASLEGHNPKHDESILLRGLYDPVMNQMIIYDMKKEAGYLASNELDYKSLLRDIDKAIDSAYANLFTVFGKYPDTEVIDFSEMA